MNKKYRDAEWLEEQYSHRKVADIADEFDVTIQTIYRWMDKNGIEREGRNRHNAPHTDEEWLSERWYSATSLQEIAEEAGVSESTITTWARKHNLPHFSEAQPWDDADKLREMYHENGMSLSEIADELGCTHGWVGQKMDEHDIERRTVKEALHKRMPSVQCYTHPQGYVYVASECGDKADKTSVHQLLAIAEGADPYDIFDGKKTVIHHNNGIKWDNRSENLEVMSNIEHGRIHYEESNMKPHENITGEQ